MKKKILCEIAALKKDVHLIEYICWWLLRFTMLATAVYFVISGEAVYQRNLILINTLATFTVGLVRLILPKKLFLSNVSYRTQTYIDLFVLVGSFLGHGLKFLGEVPEYDKFMHVLAGGVVVFIGAEIIKTFRGYDKINSSFKTFCGVGFSFIIMVAWELMEFFADWFITDSNNQNYLGGPLDTDLFIKIFGISKNSPAQNPIYDTNADMFYAVIGCIICAAILYIVLRRKELKEEEKLKSEALVK